MSNNVLDRAKYLLKRREDLINVHQILLFKIEEDELNTKLLSHELEVIGRSKEAYQKAVDTIYQESVVELESLLNTALAYVFYDQHYSIKILLDDKRGAKTLQFMLIDNNKNGREIDLKRGVGNGVRSVISFILKEFYLLNKSSHLLLLDEKYSHISEQYVGRFFDFLNKLCDDKQLCIIMISHDQRFQGYSNSFTYVSDGVITQSTEEVLSGR